MDKVLLTNKQLQMIWDDTVGSDHKDWKIKMMRAICQAQLSKATPIIEARAKKQERERIFQEIGECKRTTDCHQEDGSLAFDKGDIVITKKYWQALKGEQR